MRLLNVHNLKFHEFFDKEIPPYCILSHRWEKQEVSFKDFVKHRITAGEGYKKIVDFCSFVRDRTFIVSLWTTFLHHHRLSGETYMKVEWVWVDTCCIDKRSSAELSEAINSMYKWYSDAVECIVYLGDVGREDRALSSSTLSQSGSFRDSAWFHRGWTLQELLAPETVVFCDTHWNIIGHISGDRGVWQLLGSESSYGRGLGSEIADITRIPEEALRSRNTNWSVAEKMSWAAKRQTSRIEDQAYCLLGIFEVNMPLLYGEGSRAFLRLQYEILKTSADLSIFANTIFGIGPMAGEPSNYRMFRHRPLLAVHPTDFANAQGVPCNGHVWQNPYSMTNLGLEMRATLTPLHLASRGEMSDNEYETTDLEMSFVPLGRTGEFGSNNEHGASKQHKFREWGIGRVMTLVRHRNDQSNRFTRIEVNPDAIVSTGLPLREQLIYIQQNLIR